MPRVTADGNCLYRACSLAVSGSEDSYILLRALTSAELYCHADYYAAHPHFVSSLAKEKTANVMEAMFCISLSHEATDLLPDSSKNCSDCVRLEALRNCQDKRWSPFMCLMALSSVINLPIRSSFYPDTRARYAPNLFNARIFPRQASAGFLSPPINLFWSFIGANRKDMNPMFVTNHVVALFVVKAAHADSCVEKLNPLSSTTNSVFCSFSSSHPSSISNDHQQQSSKDAGRKPKYHQSRIPFPVKHVSDSQKAGKPKDSLSANAKSDEESVDMGTSTLSFQQCHMEKYDIGDFFENADVLPDDVRLDFLENVWKPNYSFQFPTTVIYGKKRKFNVKWLEVFPWLAYSSNVDGVFCLPCVLFGRRVGDNASKLDKLMRAPLVNWSSAIQRFTDHGQNSEIHKTAVATMFKFKQIMKGKGKSILEIQGQIVDGIVSKNRKKIESIAKTVLLCARQNIPLRGHRDDSKYYEGQDCGNFQALLDFRVDSGDE